MPTRSSACLGSSLAIFTVNAKSPAPWVVVSLNASEISCSVSRFTVARNWARLPFFLDARRRSSAVRAGSFSIERT